MRRRGPAGIVCVLAAWSAVSGLWGGGTPSAAAAVTAAAGVTTAAVGTAGSGTAAPALPKTRTAAATSDTGTMSKTGTAPALAPCADVLFIGARGSGEQGPGTPGWHATTGDRYGFGPRVQSAYARLAGDLAGHRTLQAVSVRYAANKVTTLAHDPAGYFAHLDQGVGRTVDLLKRQAAGPCPDQQIVLAGYSQGAMVMHRVLHRLDTATRARLAGAVLIADGDQVPGDAQTRYGSAPAGALGIGHLWAGLSHSSYAPFPAALRTRVLSVCNRHDPVCDITPATPWDPLLVTIHLGYTGTPPVLAAADAAARAVRALPRPEPRSATLQAYAGTPFSHRLTADADSGVTLQWGLLPPSVLPAGLDLTADGLVSGTPTATGTFTSRIRVRAVVLGVAGPWAGGRITFRVGARSGAADWTATRVPLPADAGPYGSDLSGVACPDPSLCVAVGEYADGGNNARALLDWGAQDQPAAWASRQPPVPADAFTPDYARLSDVACWSAAFCVAVGEYADTTGYYRALLLTWDGSGWTASGAPLPDDARQDPGGPVGVELLSVACVSASTCVAVGTYGYGPQGDPKGPFGLIVSGGGSSWTATRAPQAPGSRQTAPTDLSYVACGGGSCLAVGRQNGADGLELVHGTPGSWAYSPVTMPADNGSAPWQPDVTAVSCAATGHCEAVGTYLARVPDPDGTGTDGLIEGLSVTGGGSTWTGSRVPLPADAGSFQGGQVLVAQPKAVDCVATTCVTAGGYAVDHLGPGSSILYQGLLTTNGTPVQSPVPAGSNSLYGGALSSVSCVTATRCVAVGGYQSDVLVNGRYDDATAVGHPVIVTGSGTSWTARDGTLPADAPPQPGQGLRSVVCTTAGTCTITGFYVDATGAGPAFVLTGPA